MKFLGALVSATVYFSEKFEDDTWTSRWTHSTWKGSQMGSFELAHGEYTTKDLGQGIKTVEDAHFFGTSANFPEFTNEGKDLIIQYQLLYTKTINCGGGYLKVGAPIDAVKFGGETEYNIMFGPDKCGHDKRTHLIFRHHKGENNVLKTKEIPYKQDDVNVSHLYRLILKSDNSVKVFVDEEEVFSGSLSEDWELLEKKEICDPEITKPDDWVDTKMIVDANDVKPDDWVEEKRIQDMDAKKPDDWDDDEDGSWERPMIDNPDYKGEFTPKMIANPDYKGEWKCTMVANPAYEDDNTLYHYPSFGGIGIDVWQVEAGAIFSNIIVTDDVLEANKFAEIYKKTRAMEQTKLDSVESKKEAEEAERKEEEELGLDEKEDEDDDM